MSQFVPEKINLFRSYVFRKKTKNSWNFVYILQMQIADVPSIWRFFLQKFQNYTFANFWFPLKNVQAKTLSLNETFFVIFATMMKSKVFQKWKKKGLKKL